MNDEDYKESPQLSIQWLIWSINIWADYDKKRKV